MSHYSVKPLEISLRPSRLLAAVLLGLHAMALLILLVIPAPWFFRLALGTALIISFLYCRAQHVLLCLPGSVNGLKLTQSGQFSIRRTSGDWLPAEVLGGSSVKPWLTVLNLKLEEQRFNTHVLLLPDAMDQNDFRLLRTWLIWGKKSTEVRGNARIQT